METPLRGISQSRHFHWYVLGTVLIGAFMSALDASIVNIAMPSIIVSYHSRMGVVEWVSLSYLLTLTLLLPAMGRLADIHGRKPLYCSGFVLFTVGSYFCGAASDIMALIAWRVVQAAGAALLQSNSLALITQVFHERERGRAIGIQGAVQAAAMSLGPFIGGILVEHFSPMAIFYVNVPIGLAGTLVGWLVLPRPTVRKGRHSFDYPGGILFTVALSSLMLVLTQMTAHNWFADHKALLLSMALATFGAFFLVERRTPEPFIKLSLFRERNFTIGNISGMLSYVALFAPMFLLPFYLEKILMLDPERAGVLLTPVPMALSVVALFSGYLSDKFGVRPFTVGGMALTAVSLFALSTLHHDSTVFGVVWRMFLLGASLGLFTPPNNRSVMCAAPESDLSVAGGLLNMMRSLGMMCGVAFAQLIYSRELHTLLNKAAGASDPAGRILRQHDMMMSFDKVYSTMIFVALAAAVLSLVKEPEGIEKI
ncbi:MFS transporter [Candidatus Deferrimicrobium sp.]|uniref:MFS transporter n=1 Tax=Candidatus Deferrimicrobium sp. TaxID=3060586 RepID=UPI003C3AC05B